MIEAIIGGILAVIAVIFGVLFRNRGEKIKDLENELETSHKQEEIYKSNMEYSKPIEKPDNSDKTTEEMIDEWNKNR